jgi:antitoxin component of RelBE/YafQ-DinJ toxin-antitoxin module
MNVTVKIDDKLCREARHRAVDLGMSLSDWIAEVLRKELAADDTANRSLLDALSMEEGAEKAFEIPRDSSAARGVAFSE